MDKWARKRWNENHKKLKEIIVNPVDFVFATELFLTQHGWLHNSALSNSPKETLEDALLKDLDEVIVRQYPVLTPDTKNSIAWHLWHITRIEDITMNILVANRSQVLHRGNWLADMNVSYLHSGNDMVDEDIAKLSKRIDLQALIAYRKEVGRETRNIVSSLKPTQLNMEIDKERIEQLYRENALQKQSEWLARYWSKKTVAGLLLMPATRHIFLHLNKCHRIKNKYQKRVKKKA
ncbi:DinB family protein [Robertmurraya massiliosenegalensis]|uniref:DinB family protein n=1 Tax=Robertmurraya massiliosenegalensis TaxID=1287657 RepID=UPI00030E638F|nr:DinB family protein [Robertmurraya massiliosenegalensis]